MKHCPACQNQYTDPTLRFCLQDGTPLAGEVQQSSVETLAFSNPVTVGKIQQTGEMYFNTENRVLLSPPEELEKKAAQTRKWQAQPQNTAIRPDPNGSASSRLLIPAVLCSLLVLTGLGVGGWFYFNEQNRTSLENKPAVVTQPASVPQNPPSDNPVSPTKIVLDETNLPSNSNSATQTEAPEAVKKEITDFINLWKAAAESRNVADYTAKYADTVDYFDKKATLAEIRAETQKIFTSYSDIDVTLTDIRVAVNDDITQATAVFEKEWSYETDKDLLESKARTRLQFQKKGSEWKIVGEKHLKVYYLEK